VPVREVVSAGLDRVEALKPDHGFAEVTAGARGEGASVVGYVRGELGAKLTPRVSLFGFGEATLGSSIGRGLTHGWMVGVGGRVTW